MEKVSAFLNRKILGIKVLYLIAVGVVGLAVAAYVIKPKDAEIDEVSDVSADGGAGAVDAAGGASASGAAEVSDTAAIAYPTPPSGTVIVQQPGPSPSDGAVNESVLSNTEWLTRGTSFLVSNKVGGTTAQTALSTYLAGGQLSVVQRSYVDMVIAEYGLPPQGTEGRPGSDVRTFIEYIRHPTTGGVFAVYSDNTIYGLSSAARKRVEAEGEPIRLAPSGDIVWGYPNRNASKPAARSIVN